MGAGLKPKDVKAAVEGLLAVAAAQLKKQGSFKVAGCVNLKLKNKPATPAKGCQPFHEGAVRIQGKACQQDSKGFAHEKFQGDDQLSRSSESKLPAGVVIGPGGRTRQAAWDTVQIFPFAG